MKEVTSSLLGRTWQMLKTAGAVIRLSRAQEETVAANAARFLAENLGGMKGLPQKLGQILSMSEESLAQTYAPLTGNSQPLDFEVVEKVLVRAWERPVNQVVSHIEPGGLAASLGQVHRATLITGESVAVKVQYPGILKAVEIDLKMLGWLMAPLGGFAKGFDLKSYQTVVLEDIQQELDYLAEAENQNLYGVMARYIQGLAVPKVYGKLCTPQVLVTAWEEGVPLQAVAETWNEEDRRRAGRVFLSASLETLFKNGMTQGDLHPGNFRFRKTSRGEVEMVLYDFGCMFQPSLDSRLALLRLVELTDANTTGDPYPLFLKLGFNPDYLEPLADKLPALSRVMLEPFLVNGPYPLDGWHLGERVADILGDDRWNFRVAGPAELILLMRIFHGYIHTLKILGVDVSWKFALDPIRRQFYDQAMGLALPVAENPDRGFGTMAKYMYIQVIRDGQVKVRITSPLNMVDNLRLTMDDELLAKVAARGINLDELARRVRKSGYHPQEVFSLEENDKTVRIWLE